MTQSTPEPSSDAAGIDELMDDIFSPTKTGGGKLSLAVEAEVRDSDFSTPGTLSPSSPNTPSAPFGFDEDEFDDGISFSRNADPIEKDSPKPDKGGTDSPKPDLIDPPLSGLGESVLYAMDQEHSGVLVTNLDTQSVLSADDVNKAVVREQGKFTLKRDVNDDEEEVDLGIGDAEDQGHICEGPKSKRGWLARFACPNVFVRKEAKRPGTKAGGKYSSPANTVKHHASKQAANVALGYSQHSVEEGDVTEIWFDCPGNGNVS